jgi:hypothetical protein
MPVPTKLSPDQRHQQRLSYYGSLSKHFHVNRAYVIAEILVKPPEAITEADRKLLLSERSSIESAVGSIEQYLQVERFV